MKKNSFLLNKYTVAVFILLSYFSMDVFLHKGMARVMLGSSFTNQRKPASFPRCEQTLNLAGKQWIKAVNTVEKIKSLPDNIAGLEMDVYFDTVRNCLLLYHDSTTYSTLRIDAVLDNYNARKMRACIWLDFKNLSSANERQSLKYITRLRNTYHLSNRIILESSSPQYLTPFCDSGFFTSYYAPFFNPYAESEEGIIQHIDTISANLRRYHVSALSGYYFQYPLLKKYFPHYPILTWAERNSGSVISYYFNKYLNVDDQLKVILYPSK
jgi:hypothetical protein